MTVRDLKANDRDVENDPFILIMPLRSAPPNAELSLYWDELTFTPRLGFLGIDGFEYVATDGTDFSAAPARVLVTATAPVRHNSRMAVDVDGDRQATANDVLKIINCINSIGSGKVARLVSYSRDLLDVDADGEITANDVMTVINAINSRRFEGESGADAEGSSRLSEPAELIDLLAFDLAQAGTRRRTGPSA
jgi:hypothetical protein